MGTLLRKVDIQQLLGKLLGGRKVLTKVVQSKSGKVKAWLEEGPDGRVRVRLAASPTCTVRQGPGVADAEAQGEKIKAAEEQTKQPMQRGAAAARGAKAAAQAEKDLEQLVVEAEREPCKVCSGGEEPMGSCFRGGTRSLCLWGWAAVESLRPGQDRMLPYTADERRGRLAPPDTQVDPRFPASRARPLPTSP